MCTQLFLAWGMRVASFCSIPGQNSKGGIEVLAITVCDVSRAHPGGREVPH